MSEEKSSSIGTMIVVAIAAGLIGYVIGKPAPSQEQAKAHDTSEKSAELGKPAKLEELPFIEDGLVAFYPFNGNAKDESNNENDGVVNGATPTIDRHGQDGKAYSLDGKDDYIDIKKPILSPNLTSHTISAWAGIASSNPVGRFTIVSDRYGASCDYKYTIGFDKKGDEVIPLYVHYAPGFIDRSGEKGLTGDSRTLESGEWLHLVATYDLKSEFMTLYIDGKKEKELSIKNDKGNAVWSNLPNPTSIGCWRGCQSLVGANDMYYSAIKIDDMRFYNRALSADEVKALYDLEKPKGK